MREGFIWYCNKVKVLKGYFVRDKLIILNIIIFWILKVVEVYIWSVWKFV